ncbi:Dihydrodipicolinate synthetase family protein [Ceratobasidium theobromae]|uniref:Dihydrodipicolinate synthetase family protein n=1 Tax=Ceratobasidium theobromae TaxID=1582974 RepID=A0A5N5QY65_9AGAM|nr:Dihydrodipicolinate synthetase family protein [Ceratobasidium theobromae]
MVTANGTTNGINGHAKISPLTPGVYAPIPTFFLEGSEELDVPTFKKHIIYLARAGMGILVSGSMGEAHHLTPEERVILIHAAREALDSVGLTTVPVIAGTGIGSTKGTIELTRQAAEAGADYSIVIASGYYAGGLNNESLTRFFLDVAAASPIPVIVYNYPGAAGGIDLDSDTIEKIAIEGPNICGVKLTCGNVGKLTRIAATTSVPSFDKAHPRKNKDAPYLVLGGFADFILPSAFARAHGAISGLGNFAPYTLVRLTRLSFEALTNPSVIPEAQHLQDIVARADRTIAVTGIPGTKDLLERSFGYGGAPRLPLPRASKEAGAKLWDHPHVVALREREAELAGAAAKGVSKSSVSQEAPHTQPVTVSA